MRARHPILVAVGGRLRSLREEKGLSQEALALECGLDRTYIGGIERGERNVTILNLCRIAAALGVSPAVCLEGVTLDLVYRAFPVL